MDKFDLKATRNQIVAMDNKLIQDSYMGLGAIEFKALLYLISKIQPDDENGKKYIFNCREFQALLRWNKNASYSKIKDMLTNLGDASWWVTINIDGRPKLTNVRWLTLTRIDIGNGEIEIKFHEDMYPYLLELHEYYTTHRLHSITLMKHQYSIRIYQILKSYGYNNRKWIFENGTGSKYDLQLKIAKTEKDIKTRKMVRVIPDGWKNWYTFKRDVLDPAVKEINKYTDIKVEYEGRKEDIHHTKTRAVRTIIFYMIDKTEQEQQETEAFIDAEYSVVEKELDYHQSMVEEEFFKEHEIRMEEERNKKIKIEKTTLEEQTEKSEYPILFSDLNESRNAGFEENKIRELYKEAIKGRVAGTVRPGMWEVFAVDLVTHYWDKIAATPEQTKTTDYARLLDSVKNDYDRFAEELQEKYKN